LNFKFESYKSFEAIPFEAANKLLLEHGELMHSRMVAEGGPPFDIMLHINGFWDNIEQVLPPNGRYYLVWDEANELVATGALRKLSDKVGELKHMHVRATARRSGLGRALVDRRVSDAREMGLETLIADTFAANTEMPALYDRYGFARTKPLEISGTANISPELVNHMLFFRMDL